MYQVVLNSYLPRGTFLLAASVGKLQSNLLREMVYTCLENIVIIAKV